VPIIYPYVVSLIAEKDDEEPQEHRIKVEAYTISDAVVQVSLELDAKFSLAQLGYKVKIVSVTPDSENANNRIMGLLSDLNLIRSEPHGRKS
jgi:hypothetical protein